MAVFLLMAVDLAVGTQGQSVGVDMNKLVRNQSREARTICASECFCSTGLRGNRATHHPCVERNVFLHHGERRAHS